MALDHYVPQVHLRRFLAPELGPRLHAKRKTDGFRFSPKPQDVCRIEQGSTNLYLSEPRAIEEFLKAIEPHYNKAVDALRGGSTEDEHVGVIAGFVAYVASCSPTAMRVNSEPLRSVVEVTADIMEKHDAIDPPPPQLGAGTLTDLIRDGTVQIGIDRKFPQAIGIEQVVELARRFESCDWYLLHSPSPSKAFVTSDFPAAIEETGPMRPINRVVALSPELAVRVVPGHTAMTRQRGTSATGDRRHRTAGGHEVVEANRTIVRSAEEIVFFRDDAPWIGPFVNANKEYRVTAETRRVPRGNGWVLMTSVKVGKIKA